jgi:hypothetical protein
MPAPATKPNPLDGLSTLLATASALVRDLAGDPLRQRYLRVYDRIPDEDRPVIVDVLEREVALRAVTADGGEMMTGCGGRPNPNAQLYVRVLEKAPERAPVLDHEQMVFSNVRAAQLMRHALSPELHEAWRASVVEAFATLEPDARRDVGTVLRILLEIVARPPSVP